MSKWTPPTSYETPEGLRRPPPRKVRYRTKSDAVVLWFFRSFAIPLLWLPVPLFGWTARSFAFWLGPSRSRRG